MHNEERIQQLLQIVSLYRVLFVSTLLILIGSVLVLGSMAYFSGWKEQAIGLGASFITAGILALTLDLVTTRSIIERLEARQQAWIGQQTIKNAGLIEVARDGTDYIRIAEAISTGTEFILIQTWCPQLTTFLAAAEAILAKNGTIKIFLLHPDSHAARRRSMDLGHMDKQHVVAKIKTDTREIRNFYSKMKEKYGENITDIQKQISLKYYWNSPTCAIYKSSNVAWLALYWLDMQSDDAPNILVDTSTNNQLAQRIEKHIETIELEATPVPLDEPNAKISSIDPRDK